MHANTDTHAALIRIAAAQAAAMAALAAWLQ